MITLELFQREDNTLYWEVGVRSEVKPTVIKIGMLEFGNSNEQQKLGILAGAVAEQLCEEYQDTVEPSAVAHTAMEVYQELMAENPHIRTGTEVSRDADKHIAAGRVARHR